MRYFPRRAVIFFAVCCAALAGCWRSASPPAPVPPVVVAQQPAMEKVADAPPPELVADPPMPEEPAPPPVPALPAEKLLILSPRGPLVVEFEIWIDGQPQSQVFSQLLDEVLKLADVDGDGQPMWKEVVASPKFRYGQFGNLPFERESAPKQIIQQYDSNGNGQVDRSELPRFLTRNAGGARAFSLRSLEQFHGRNRRGSPTWRILDSDADGELTAEELQRAFAQLKLHDSDDDEILQLDELRPVSDVDPTNANRVRGLPGHYARLLGEFADWDSIRTALEQTYALGGNLGVDDFELMGEIFQQLDQDKDGKLLKKEFPELNNVKPHLRFRIDFGMAAKDAEKNAPEKNASEKNNSKPVTLKLLSSRLTPEQTGGAPLKISELPGRVILGWPGVEIMLVRNDTIAATDYDALAQQGLTMYDADANGYLDTKEVNEQVQAQFARFEALDSDNDGKVYVGEIAAFLRQRQGAQRAQIHARAQDQEDALFLALDQNHDDRLDARELETAVAHLKQFDTNGDGKLTADELPGTLAIVIARGSLENPNQLFAIGPTEARAPAGNLPSWFAAMDTSGDGVISSREFLGTAEQFAELDKNKNGFFEPSEIPAVEVKEASAEPAAERTSAQ